MAHFDALETRGFDERNAGQTAQLISRLQDVSAPEEWKEIAAGVSSIDDLATAGFAKIRPWGLAESCSTLWRHLNFQCDPCVPVAGANL